MLNVVASNDISCHYAKRRSFLLSVVVPNVVAPFQDISILNCCKTFLNLKCSRLKNLSLRILFDKMTNARGNGTVVELPPKHPRV
jgi:hypothetical protein